MSTALDDLRGIWRLFRSRKVGPATGQRALPARPEAYVSSKFATEEDRPVDFDTFTAAGYEAAVDQSVSFTGRNAAFFAERKVDILESIVSPVVGPLRGLSVLDVGCGTGTTDRVLMPRVGRLQGVDISEEMLAKARINVPSAGYSWYDGEKVPFGDQTFDAVVAICVLHHVPISNRFGFVSEMVRVVRPGGVVAVFEHNPMNPLTRRVVIPAILTSTQFCCPHERPSNSCGRLLTASRAYVIFCSLLSEGRQVVHWTADFSVFLSEDNMRHGCSVRRRSGSSSSRPDADDSDRDGSIIVLASLWREPGANFVDSEEGIPVDWRRSLQGLL